MSNIFANRAIYYYTDCVVCGNKRRSSYTVSWNIQMAFTPQSSAVSPPHVGTSFFAITPLEQHLSLLCIQSEATCQETDRTNYQLGELQRLLETPTSPYMKHITTPNLFRLCSLLFGVYLRLRQAYRGTVVWTSFVVHFPKLHAL